MSLDEGLSRFIGSLYEAVYDPDAWKLAIAQLMDRTGSRIAFISSVDLRQREFSRTDFYAPEESAVDTGIREYSEETYGIDPSLIWAAEHPEAGVCETSSIIPRADYLDHPFIKWNKSRFGTTHWRVMYTKPADDLSFSLSLHPPAEVGPAPRELRALHRLLFEHMERALRLAVRPPDLSRDKGAILALDRNGCVVAMSPRAEALLAANDGLSSNDRQLHGLDRTAAVEFRAAVRSAVRGGCGAGVRLKRRSGKPDWLALVSPYPQSLDHLPIPSTAAVVRIVEPNGGGRLATEHAQLFELTSRELAVAEALLEGHSLESLASSLGISRNTARVHLQSLFQKTATNRQVDLVHLLAEIAHASA
jgi:DNA-binding CsgD family transcriptional regulator/PAS domain-containing protein